MCSGQLVGVTSYGINCGENPGVYARVSEYAEWIKQCAKYPNSTDTKCSACKKSHSYLVIIAVYFILKFLK